MSFGSFLRGAYHQVNPFDRGQTFASVQQDEERKRRQAQINASKKALAASQANGGKLSVGKAQGSQLQVQKPRTPKINITNTLQDLPKFSVATNLKQPTTPTFSIGRKNQQVQKPLTPQGGLTDFLGGALYGGAKAVHDWGEIVPQAVGQLKAVTPKPLDPLADKLRGFAQDAVDKPYAIPGTPLSYAGTPKLLDIIDELNKNTGALDITGKPTSKAYKYGAVTGEVAPNVLALGTLAKDIPKAYQAAKNIPQGVRALRDVVLAAPKGKAAVKAAATDAAAYRRLNKAGVNLKTAKALQKETNVTKIEDTLSNIFGGSNEAIKQASLVISKSDDAKFLEKTIMDLPYEALGSVAGSAIVSDQRARKKYGVSPLTNETQKRTVLPPQQETKPLDIQYGKPPQLTPEQQALAQRRLEQGLDPFTGRADSFIRPETPSPTPPMSRPTTPPTPVRGVPRAGQGSTPVANVTPESLSNRLTQAVEAGKTKYKDSSLFRRAEEKFNPAAPLSRIDQGYAKSLGTNNNTLPRSESLEHLSDKVRTSATQADAIAEERGLKEIVRKYPGKQQNDFMNYLNARRSIDTGIPLRLEDGNSVAPDVASQFVANYERANPNAKFDAKRVSDFFGERLIESARAGVIPEQEAIAAIKSEASFVPWERIIPEELQRARIPVQPIGTLGNQKVLRELEGGGIPLANGFDVLFRRNAIIQNQIRRAELFNKFRQRVEQGIAPDSVIKQSADQVLAKRAAKGRFDELQGIYKTLVTQKRGKTTQFRIAGINKKNTDTAAIQRAKKLLRDTVTDPDAKAAISNMSNKDLAQTLALAAEPDIKKTQNVQRIYNNFVKNNQVYQRIADELQGVKSDISAIQSGKSAARAEQIGLSTDSLTGRQVISGLDRGVPVKIETTPEVARVLGGLNQGELVSVVKAAQYASRPFRAAWTGLVAPIFNFISAAHYDPEAGFVVSKNGARAILSPSAWKAFFKSFDNSTELQMALRKGGAQVVYGSEVGQDLNKSVARIAAQDNLVSRLKFYGNPKNIKQSIEALDELSGKLAAANRSRFAEAAQQAALQKGMTPEQAVEEAIYAYNNVAPNFVRSSTLLKNIDAFLPYTSASVAGTRSMGIAVRRRPIKTLAKLAGAAVAPSVVTTAHNLSQPQGQAFYKDAIDSGKTSMLNSNLVIVMPWASKDKETGQWSGVFKIPVAPEFRALNKGTWRAAYDGIANNKLSNPLTYATAIFDSMTGGLLPITTEGGKITQQYGSSNPAVALGLGVAYNKNIQTGQDIVPEDLKDLPKDQQATQRTGGLARLFGKLPGLNPMTAQYAINEFGSTGRIAQSGVEKAMAALGLIPKEQVSDASLGGELAARYNRVYTRSQGSEFYASVDEATKGLNKNEKDAFFGAVMPSKKDAAGNALNDKTYYDSAAKAITWLKYDKTFEASKRIDAENRKKGEPGDPLFDLSPDKRKIILNLMANYSPGNYEEKAIQKLNPWIKDFYKERSDFFDKVNENNKSRLQQLESRPDAKTNDSIKSKIKNLKTNAANYGIDPMGMKQPIADKNLQTKLDNLSKLGDGKTKHQYIVDNPDVADFFTEQNNYKRAKRSFLGLPQFDNYPTPDANAQKIMDEYSKLPKGDGPLKKDGTPSSPTRSAWIKSHQKEWDIMGAAFDKIAAWNAADEGALAVYEGLNAEGNPEGTPLKGGTGSGSGGGYNYTPYQKTPNINITNVLGKFGESQKSPIRSVDLPKVKEPSIKLPRGTTKKINIPGLALPNRRPTYGYSKSRRA